MRQSLQSKFNLLGLLLVAFFLLMLPMFTQVKQDTRDSLKEARNTSLYKFSNELMKDIKKPSDLDDTQVEDYWDEYQKEAREADPDCPACNPDADADGDGMSNKEEVEKNRNPLCNEEEKGVEHCQNVDDKVEDPLPPPGVPVLLYNITFTAGGNCSNFQFQPFGGSCGTWPMPVSTNFTVLVAYLNLTNFQGNSWAIDLDSDEGSQWDYGEDQWQASSTGVVPGTSTPPPRTFSGRAMLAPTEAAEQSATLTYSSPATNNPSGEWNILVYGIR